MQCCRSGPVLDQIRIQLLSTDQTGSYLAKYTITVNFIVKFVMPHSSLYYKINEFISVLKLILPNKKVTILLRNWQKWTDVLEVIICGIRIRVENFVSVSGTGKKAPNPSGSVSGSAILLTSTKYLPFLRPYFCTMTTLFPPQAKVLRYLLG